MSGERVTRGRLSSLDLSPEEGHDDIVWAMAQLNERKRSQEDIRFELNDRLAVKGIDAISKSAFNRRAVRIAPTKGLPHWEKLPETTAALDEFWAAS